ncbi:MAG: class D beta-lactamase [Hyphomicrobiales bacterium]
MLRSALSFAFVAMLAPQLATAKDMSFDDLFDRYNTAGTIVIESRKLQKSWVHNVARADTPKRPASTFKIPNSVFALEAEAVEDVDEIVPWNGKDYNIKAWNKPHSLRSAYKVSSLPTYQELATRIGLEKMAEFVTKTNYGNGKIGGKVDKFWIWGPLEITANQQIDFLKRLETRTLPFSKQAQEATIGIMEARSGNGWVLRAKTGWALNPKPAVGWYVGWLEKGDDVLFFAMNMDMLNPKIHRQARIEIATEALERVIGEPLK